MAADFEGRVDRLVEAVRAEDGTPGVALAVTDGAGTLFERTYGFADLAARAPLRPHHRMEFGSIGKSFTAVLLLLLEAEGLVSLTDRVEQYLPWFSVSNRPPIRLGHLLSHTSGLIGGTDFAPDARLEVWALRSTETVWPPGARFHYSNLGFKILGLVLKAVTGRPYRELVRDRILDPLGMAETDAVITHDTRRELATGHQSLYDDRPYWPEDPLVPAPWVETDTADGSLVSTAGDLARYVRFLLNGFDDVGGRLRLLSAPAFRRFVTPLVAAGADEWYALGIARYGSGDGAPVGHSGGMLGYHAQILADPKSDLGVAVMLNGPGRAPLLAREVLALAVRARSGEALGPEPIVSRTVVEEAERWAGTYRSATGDVLHIAAAPAGELQVTWNGEATDPPRASDAGLVSNHPALRLFPLEPELHARGVVAIHHGDATYRRRGQEADDPPLPASFRPYPGHYRSHNPWASNFRVAARGGRLVLIPPEGPSSDLAPLDARAGHFRLTEDGMPLPEDLRFEATVDGEAFGCTLAGHRFARFFTP